MADPLSILQVAGIGVQLVKTLYTYGKSVHDSQNEIAAVAREVELTCQVLDNLAKVLQQDNAQSMCSATLKADASNTLNGCKAAFKELDSALQTTLKSQKGVKSKSRLPFSTRAKWPLDKTKIASLQSNLERLKTTLSLMLDVINLALKQTEEYVSPTDQDSISLISLANPPISQYKQTESDRLRIERLIKSNEELYQSITNGFQAHSLQSPGAQRGMDDASQVYKPESKPSPLHKESTEHLDPSVEKAFNQEIATARARR